MKTNKLTQPDKPSVLITGGASGLGLALAHEYAAQGYKICIADVQTSLGEQVALELNSRGTEAFFIKLDVTNDEDWVTVANVVFERWRSLDVLINNAGVASCGLIEDQSIDDWQWQLDINVMGVVRGCKAFVPMMKKRGQGHIVNVASMAGLLHMPTMSAYNVSKASVVALSETLLIELDNHNVGVTVVCPAFFKTNLTNTMRSAIPGIENTVNRWMSSSQITADDVAKSTFDAMFNGDFYVLTHRREKWLWWLKRMSPKALQVILKKAAKKQLKRAIDKATEKVAS